MPEELSLQMRLLRAFLIAAGILVAAMVCHEIKFQAEHQYRMLKVGPIKCAMGDTSRCGVWFWPWE